MESLPFLNFHGLLDWRIDFKMRSAASVFALGSCLSCSTFEILHF